MNGDSKLNVFDRVTQRIIADLEKGVRPWQKPWGGDKAAPRIVRPKRHNGEPYNGVNILLLWDAAIEKNYQNPTWMTFKQAEEYGAHVRKGEKSSFVVYANKVTKLEHDEITGADIERQIPFLRGYHVFNVEQIDGLPEKFLLPPQPSIPASSVTRLEKVEHFINNTGARINYGGNRAYYAEGADHIQMPPSDAFIDGESFYATLTHELTHWTKHESRLHRDFGRIKYGDEGYAREELVAEMGAAFLCADLGITPEIRDDHAAYIGHWLQALKNDRKLIFTAAAHATRAVEFLKAKQPQPVAEVTVTVDSLDRPTLYIGEPMKIGQHSWRMKIERSDRGGLVTLFEFEQEGCWHRQREWAHYDFNDTYLGLPRGLSKLYEREQPALVRFGLLKPPPSKQIELGF